MIALPPWLATALVLACICMLIGLACWGLLIFDRARDPTRQPSKEEWKDRV